MNNFLKGMNWRGACRASARRTSTCPKRGNPADSLYLTMISILCFGGWLEFGADPGRLSPG